MFTVLISRVSAVCYRTAASLHTSLASRVAAVMSYSPVHDLAMPTFKGVMLQLVSCMVFGVGSVICSCRVIIALVVDRTWRRWAELSTGVYNWPVVKR